MDQRRKNAAFAVDRHSCNFQKGRLKDVQLGPAGSTIDQFLVRGYLWCQSRLRATERLLYWFPFFLFFLFFLSLLLSQRDVPRLSAVVSACVAQCRAIDFANEGNWNFLTWWMGPNLLQRVERGLFELCLFPARGNKQWKRRATRVSLFVRPINRFQGKRRFLNYVKLDEWNLISFSWSEGLSNFTENPFLERSIHPSDCYLLER